MRWVTANVFENCFQLSICQKGLVNNAHIYSLLSLLQGNQGPNKADLILIITFDENTAPELPFPSLSLHLFLWTETCDNAHYSSKSRLMQSKCNLCSRGLNVFRLQRLQNFMVIVYSNDDECLCALGGKNLMDLKHRLHTSLLISLGPRCDS